MVNGYATEIDFMCTLIYFCPALLEVGLFHLIAGFLLPHLPSYLALDSAGREVGHHLWR